MSARDEVLVNTLDNGVPAAVTEIKSVDKNPASRFVFDATYYKARYPDLAALAEDELLAHWTSLGYREGRFASLTHETGDAQLVIEQVAGRSDRRVVDPKFYAAVYSDLKVAGVVEPADLEAHYVDYGKLEGRDPSLSVWAERTGVPLEALPLDFDLSAVIDRCHDRGIHVDGAKVLDILQGINALPIWLDANPVICQRAFRELGEHWLKANKKQQGRHLLDCALAFGDSPMASDRLGSSYMEDGHFLVALKYCKKALESPNPPVWSAFNAAYCLTKLHRLDEALVALSRHLAAHPNHRPTREKFEKLAVQKWNDIYPVLMSHVDNDGRAELVDAANTYAQALYSHYYRVFGGDDAASHGGGATLPCLKELNTNRILIVGDFHISQCVRYRIDQKIEQLKLHGVEASAISWTNLAKEQNALAFHDIVIFYRVPAHIDVIKAIAQVNATGRLSLYEIDDLLFDPEYPPSLDSYGGYVDLNTYRDLTRGMALFNAAAKLCRKGIASTALLQEKLAALVIERECWLHRNGLDKLNYFSERPVADKSTIDLFYGSGTQAHNSDFIDQALPAITRVLDECPKARLVVVGYLKLPQAFIERYVAQLVQLPALKSVEAYWSLLEKADINIAVLTDDELNGCKSELKWFEAACFSIPSVVSTTHNYRDVIRDGVDGFIARDEDTWYAALSLLVADEATRKEIGAAAQLRVKEDYSARALGKSLAEQIRSLDQKSVAASNSRTRTKPKVALVNVFFPPQAIGGATRVVTDNFHDLINGYSDDLELCVFTADVECREPHQVSVYNYKGANVYRATTLWREHMDWHPSDPEMYDLFIEFLRNETPDLIHFHCVQRLTASVVEAARDAGIPYIVTVHDAWWISDYQFLVDHNAKVYEQGHPDPYESAALPVNISLEASIERKRKLKSLINQAVRIFTVSESFADIYRINGVPRIEVSGNGISADVIWMPRSTSDSPRVVCGHIGGMAEHKGYYLLKQAALAIQPKNLEFLVVDHSKPSDYECRSTWGEVAVRFIGRVSQDKIQELYSQMDILMAPSLWPESYGLVTREAAAAGCWVVASRLGGIGESVTHGVDGYVIEPNLPTLSAMLMYVDNSPEKFKSTPARPELRTSFEQAAEMRASYLDCINIRTRPHGAVDVSS